MTELHKKRKAFNLIADAQKRIREKREREYKESQTIIYSESRFKQNPSAAIKDAIEHGIVSVVDGDGKETSRITSPRNRLPRIYEIDGEVFIEALNDLKENIDHVISMIEEEY